MGRSGGSDMADKLIDRNPDILGGTPVFSADRGCLSGRTARAS